MSARAAIVSLSLFSLGACATLPQGQPIDRMPDNEIADLVSICVTPPATRIQLSDMGVAPNGLLPLQSRLAACASSPDYAFQAFSNATVADTGRRLYGRAPESTVMELPVNQPGVFIVAVADGERKLAGYHVLANSIDYSCGVTLSLNADNTVTERGAWAHTYDQPNPISFDTIATMARANQMTGGSFACVDPLQRGVSVLQRPDFEREMRLIFARKMTPGPRLPA